MFFPGTRNSPHVLHVVFITPKSTRRYAVVIPPPRSVTGPWALGASYEVAPIATLSDDLPRDVIRSGTHHSQDV